MEPGGWSNAYAPSVVASGPVIVEVTNRFGRSVFAATAKLMDPAFFVVGTGGDGQSLAAAVHPDGTLVGEVGSLPGTTMRPTKPGAPIIVFGTGFGPTNPPVREGVIGFPPAPLARDATVFMGGQKVQLDFAGLVGPGLVQINLRVPEFLAAGRHSIVAAVGGVESSQNVVIAVE